MADRVKFYVEDMTCGHCERSIREALAEHLPGATVAVDLGLHQVQVEGSAQQAETAIRDAGYTPVLLAS
ncbi:heavy metal-associated domain-containing protein [Rhizobium sp.]|jgi:copper chaperone|uniref:heavy-metal-associated domain-containing protein n=1 Tax=Rhizobium sp. TaxID=391 RepID=UPI000E9BEFB2|nr:copper chaperone [Rhizobium sp.]